jgi:hypothetical protein
MAKAANKWWFCRQAAAVSLAALAAGSYAWAFTLGAVDWGSGYYLLGSRLTGSEAFGSAWHFPPLWPANPCAWLGLAALACGKWRTAFAFAVAGGLSGLTVVPMLISCWFENGRAHFEAGYYVWMASFAALLAGALVVGLLSPREA